MKDLLGGEERIDPKGAFWGDSLIVNLGTPEYEGEDKYIHPTELENWHVDGDFFVRPPSFNLSLNNLLFYAHAIITTTTMTMTTGN